MIPTLNIAHRKSHQSHIISHRYSHLEQNFKIKCHNIIRKQRIHLLTNKILFVIQNKSPKTLILSSLHAPPCLMSAAFHYYELDNHTIIQRVISNNLCTHELP